MRHLLSALLALVLTPLIYVSAGYSAVKLGEANGGTVEFAPAALGLLAALVAGGLYALLVMARLSPVGPVLAGLAYLGVTIWALVSPSGFANAMPGGLFGVDNVLHVPVGFGTALLAVPLLVTIFSPRRWRRSAEPAETTFDTGPAYPPSPGTAAPDYGTPTSYAATTAFDTIPSAAPSYEPHVYTPPSSPAPTYPGFIAPAQPGAPDEEEGRPRFM